MRKAVAAATAPEDGRGPPIRPASLHIGSRLAKAENLYFDLGSVDRATDGSAGAVALTGAISI